jgi:predicted secreted protein
MTQLAGYTPLISASADDATYSVVGGLNNATIGFKRIDLDISEMGVEFKKRIAGLKSGQQITLGGYYHADETGQSVIRTAFASGAAIWIQFAADGTGGTSIRNQPVKVQGYNIKTSNEGLVSWDCTLVFHGLGDATHHAEAAYTASAPIAGYSSRITICDTSGGTYYDVLGSREFSFSYSRSMQPQHDFSSTYTGTNAAHELHAAGLFSGSFSMSGDAQLDATGQAHIRSGLKGRADRYIKALWDGTNGQILQGLCTGYTYSGSFDGPVSYSANFTLQAAPTATP